MLLADCCGAPKALEKHGFVCKRCAHGFLWKRGLGKGTLPAAPLLLGAAPRQAAAGPCPEQISNFLVFGPGTRSCCLPAPGTFLSLQLSVTRGGRRDGAVTCVPCRHGPAGFGPGRVELGRLGLLLGLQLVP